MKKNFKIIFGIISILVLGGFLLFIFTNEFKRTINVGDCEGIYYKKLFEKPNKGYLEMAEINAKNDIGNCLCEKYERRKDPIYKKEILKIYHDVGMKWEKHEKPKINIDSICKYRNEIFFRMYDM